MTADGIRTKSGKEIKADIIITATGLKMVQIGGIDLEVDGQPVVLSNCFSYKGLMLSGVPNFINVGGYINASWTLRCDLV